MKKAVVLALAGGLFGGTSLFSEGALSGLMAALALPFLFAAAARAGKEAGLALAPAVLLVSAAASALHGLTLLAGLQLAGAVLLLPALKEAEKKEPAEQKR